jgi:hypothetical protein
MADLIGADPQARLPFRVKLAHTAGADPVMLLTDDVPSASASFKSSDAPIQVFARYVEIDQPMA